jgi:hypothetical protein
MPVLNNALRIVSRSRRKEPMAVAALVAVIAVWNLACGVSFSSCSTSAGREVNFGFPANRATLGSGRVATEVREASGFSAIDLRGIGKVIVSIGDHEAVTVEAEDNLLPLMSTTVRDGVLVLDFKSGTFCTTEPVVYRVTARQLSALNVSGVGTIEASGLSAPHLRTMVTGPGSLRLERLAVDELESTLSGVGSLLASGTATRLILKDKGPGSFHGSNLAVNDARVTLDGVGSAEVRVSDTLKADVSGTGSVRYLGDPHVESKITGFGKVQPS